MMTPFAVGTGGSTFAIAVASVTNYASSGVTVDWESDASCSTAASPLGASARTLATSPTNLLPTAGSPGDSVIVVRVSYVYDSAIQFFFPGLSTLTHTAFARPRSNGVVTCNSSPCT